MIVVADTSPINYLLLIEEIRLLPALFTNILIPHRVHQELLSNLAPPIVRHWASQLPAWCEVRHLPPDLNTDFGDLHAGEIEAIRLALHIGSDRLLMDDAKGRHAAQQTNLQVTGTIAILELAAQQDLLLFRPAFARLEQTSFRVSAAVRDAFLKRNP